jgi:thiopurine S-methyltransferase
VSFDLIVEQTFFCALDPALRQRYFQKMGQLLKPGGKLMGVLFDDVLNNDRPPFGGSKKEYLSYIDSSFEIKTLETCYNSIQPRAGKELFMNLIKRG